jgi:hypothetical protein
MQPDLVLVKTPKGLAEFEHRSSTLTMLMRRLLIMIDGQHTVAALIHFHAGSFDVITALEQLVTAGLIAPANGNAAPPPDTHASKTPRQALIHMAVSLLGSDKAEKVIGKLQGAGDENAELKPVVESCERLIRLTIDEAKAGDFRLQANLILGKKGNDEH